MVAYLIRRIANSALVLVTVTGLCYMLLGIRGGYVIASNIVGPAATPEEIQRKVVELGLDQPLIVQYAEWLAGFVRGDLGQSFVSSQQIMAILSVRVPVTLSLIFASLVLTLVMSVLLGVVASTRGGVVDRSIQGLSVILGAVPSYWLALILAIFFALNLRLFPATGFIPITESLPGWLSTIALPVIAISLGPTFGLAVWIRSSIIDLRRQDWVRTLRSRGLSQRAIMYRHVLRNAAASTVQLLGLMIIGLVGGTIIVERIFALPGVGTMLLNSGTAGDVPAVLGAVTFMVVVIVIINVVVDVLNGVLNPKARVS